MPAENEIEYLKTFVRGEPCPQPRPHASVMRAPGTKMGFRGHVHNPEKYPKGHPKHGQYLPYILWRQHIKNHIRSIMRMPEEPLDEPIILRLQFFMPRTEELMRPKAPWGAIPCDKKPDLDNLVKLVKDVLTTVWDVKVGDEVKQRGIWVDDGRVFRCPASKWYPARTDSPGVSIGVYRIAKPEPTLFETKPKAALDFRELVHPRDLLPAGRPTARE